MSIDKPIEYSLANSLAERRLGLAEWNEPTKFDLTSEIDKNQMEQMIRENKIIQVIDPVDLISEDLFELHSPSLKNDDVARYESIASIKQQGINFGNWFYFPWSKQLVRYPNAADHRALRTARNRNLITESEQKGLFDSTIAIFGLSVGSNIVDELVRSGVGGKIIIGDPDHISPSNLNRIRSSLHEVGDKKIDRLAKKISEIDPYIEQVHFREGMTKANLDQLAEHKPNIIFDEVDDLEAKLALRLFARQHKIPLVMVTDLGDKSLVDIERYDQGHRMPFSGRLKEVELEALIAGELTKEEIKRLTVRIIGMRHITPRLLSSVMEIDKSISGIPQLGTTAAAGGALGSIVAREIILGRKLKSGRRVFSPKDTLHLQSPTSFEHGFKTVSKFIRTQKKTKK